MTLTPREQFRTARLYLCTDSRAATGDFEAFVDSVFAAGVDVIQLREKGLEAGAEIALLEVLRAAALRHGRLFAVNDRADVAAAVDAPILHLGQDDLPVPVARRLLGSDVVIGRSTHSPQQFDAAMAESGVDYVCAGPTWTTPTKPGRPAAGVELLEHAAGHSRARPWFAIGGIDLQRLPTVVAAGATRVVVVRAITEAADPAAATREILRHLPAVS
ncbi:thiamine-phosphate pyrophosphorylase [Jatrophihabitans sp. GAS493]|nr:thiamine phosphate synthase [Jatrophihabitans sp. GAS493]SOD74041.1 thiamine-phosphate pyrophosphorylase [Jatrophihabitans sp. GAS493]